MARRKPAHPRPVSLINEVLTLIEDSGRKYSDIAQETGIDSSAISHFKSGRYKSANVDTLQALLNTLGYELHIRKKEPLHAPTPQTSPTERS